jgi:hypothetical protein
MKRRSTPRNVLSFEPSSGAFSTGAFAGVDALEGSLEEAAAELSCDVVAGASAMVAGVRVCAAGDVCVFCGFFCVVGAGLRR